MISWMLSGSSRASLVASDRGSVLQRALVLAHVGEDALAQRRERPVAQRVTGAAALELVERHHVGEVAHVDLLQLGGGAELGRHHVQ